MSFPKPIREQDEKYLNFVRSKPCCCQGMDCMGAVVPAHTITRAAGGSDYRAIPMCFAHHSEAHQKGMKGMEEKYNFSAVDLVISILGEYVKMLK